MEDRLAETSQAEVSLSDAQSPESAPAIPIHPYAAMFPPLDGEELDELVEDIRENGLRHPIVLDANGQVVDGRNRLVACKLAGVEPRFDTTDVDPLAFIVSANVMRRHLSKGQRAMAVAIAYPEATEKGGRGKTAVSNTGVSREYITKARFVQRHAPELVAKVMAGWSLSEAYSLADTQKRDREEYERLRQDVASRVSAIQDVCARLAANIERSATAFIDQDDFVREVHSAAKEISESATELAKVE